MNKIVWITGAGTGIGKALALAYNADGDTIILSGRKRDSLDDVAAQLQDSFVHPLDVADEQAILQAVTTVKEKYGKVDILINNAGVSQRSLVTETNNDVGRKLMEVNFFGSVHLSKAVLPLMLASGKGNIVGMSSAAGKFGFPLRSYYSASKHAMHGFYETLGLELKDTEIYTTMVCPGRIKTDLSKSAMTGDGAPHEAMDPGQANGIDADVCARKIKRAVSRNKAEVYIGGSEILMIYFKRYAPWLFRFIARRISAK